MKKKKIVCNFKTAVSINDYQQIIEDVSHYEEKNVDIIFAPPVAYMALDSKGIKKCSQDISFNNSFYEVGEITASTIKEANAEYVLIGHCHRRNYYGEKETDFVKKITVALDNNLTVIYCVGETLEEFERRKSLSVLEHQIARVLNNVDNLNNIVIAYEPVFLISNMSKKFNKLDSIYLNETLSFIKNLIKNYYNIEIPLLYGGSVNSENIEFLKSLDVDGVLLGKSALDTQELIKICDSFI